MIKMVCIQDSGYSLPHYSVINGKIYNCQRSLYKDYYAVSNIDMDTYIGLFDKKLFLTLAEWREKQINSILKDE